jgi:hypothetical protein
MNGWKVPECSAKRKTILLLRIQGLGFKDPTLRPFLREKETLEARIQIFIKYLQILCSSTIFFSTVLITRRLKVYNLLKISIPTVVSAILRIYPYVVFCKESLN